MAQRRDAPILVPQAFRWFGGSFSDNSRHVGAFLGYAIAGPPNGKLPLLQQIVSMGALAVHQLTVCLLQCLEFM